MTNITAEELLEINTLRTKLATTVNEVGQWTLERELLRDDMVELDTRIDTHTTAFKSLLNDEVALVKRLSEKYGIGSIDFETGEFIKEN